MDLTTYTSGREMTTTGNLLYDISVLLSLYNYGCSLAAGCADAPAATINELCEEIEANQDRVVYAGDINLQPILNLIEQITSA